MYVSTTITKKIRAAMLLRGISETDIARKLGVVKQAVSNTIHGAPSAHIREEICRILNTPPDIWKQMDRELKVQKEAKKR
jgi:transcriptional regulator with XRE-family HTH domain